MTTCGICGGAIFPANTPYGYVGLVCNRNHTAAAPAGAPPFELGRVVFMPTPLTADEVRRIVREEMTKALNDSGLPPYMVKP